MQEGDGNVKTAEKKTGVIESETENVKWGEKVRDGEGERANAKIDIWQEARFGEREEKKTRKEVRDGKTLEESKEREEETLESRC